MEWNIRICFFLLKIFSIGICQDESRTYDYCNPIIGLCEEPTDHTMCKYPNEGPSSRCDLELYNPLTEEEKTEIVEFHNKMRSKVATGAEKSPYGDLPPASNMRQMYWDPELEMIAKRWADQCFNATSSNHFDKCRNTRRFRVGQNVDTRGIQSTSLDKFAIRVFVWYSELKNFDPRRIESHAPTDDPKKRTSQFTVMIWAKSFAIGCARGIFHEIQPDENEIWTFERLICNYGPAGNVLGQSVYNKGTPCSQCPPLTSCSSEYKGLCSVEEPKPISAKDIPVLRAFDVQRIFTTTAATKELYKTETEPSTRKEVPLKKTTNPKATVAYQYNEEKTRRKRGPNAQEEVFHPLKRSYSRREADFRQEQIYNGEPCYCARKISAVNSVGPNSLPRPLIYYTYYLIIFLND